MIQIQQKKNFFTGFLINNFVVNNQTIMLGLRSMLSRLTIRSQTFYQPVQCIHLTEVDLRARKGTREKREKLKKKNKTEKLNKITKVGYIPRSKMHMKKVDKHLTNDWKAVATDDAFPGRYYRHPVFKVADAIRFHKENLDPTMWNALDSPLNMSVEMDMMGDKPTRFVSNFQKLVVIKNPFEHGQERTILVFAKEEEHRSNAIKAGATTVGGPDLVKMALKGNIRFADYQFILAHPDIMPEMLALRGLLKKRFPSAKNETLGVNLFELVTRFINGIFISGRRDEFQENFGVVKTSIGYLNMPTENLIDNFHAILTTINGQRPNRPGKFITRVHLSSPNSKESFKVDPIDFPFEDYVRPGEIPTLPQKKKKNQQPKFVRNYQLFRTPV